MISSPTEQQQSVALAFDRFIAMLRCPSCAGALRFTETDARNGRSGVLACGCSRYPVLEGVPILMKRPVGIISHWNDADISQGPTAAELVTMLESGKADEALARCLVFPRHYPGQRQLTKARVWPSELGNRAGLLQTRKKLDGLLARRSGDVFAEDLFRFFYSRRSANNPFLAEYFLNRFVLPRYLSAMSVVQRIPSSTEPILDIACGYGNFEHFLTRRGRPNAAVGIDFNFYQIWGAKHWVAPDAQFACCDVGQPLPFVDGAFSAMICSDAFMLFPDQALLRDEVHRVAPGRPQIYARCGNVDVGPPNPPSGGERTPEGYQEFFGRERTRLLRDSQTWRDYLLRRHPYEATELTGPELRWEKYLTFVVHPETLTGEPDASGMLPHGIGRLTFNPVMDVVGRDGDTIRAEFMFKSPWGGYEDADMMCYTPRWGRFERQKLQQAVSDPTGAAARDLVDRFVLVGLPDRYRRGPALPA
jgi:SAM-dependent methyltransferase/uncharacterized protein YbaR (Trm112 family)